MKYENKRRLIIWISLFILLVFYLFKNFSESVRVFGFILGISIFYFTDKMFEIDFQFRHYLYALIILSFGILFSPLYFLIEVYDKILHFFLPMLGGLLVFYVIEKQKLSFQWKLLITFMFVISFLTIHEIGEYLIDLLWDLKLQGVYVRDISGIEKLNLVLSKHDDTMVDLIMGFVGALVFVIAKAIEKFYRKRLKSKH
jgi:hypothetical protein